MRRARIVHEGRSQWGQVSDDDGTIVLAGGQTVETGDALWLPPVSPCATVFALGLNYADHSRELGFAAKQATPLVFLKGQNSFVGHQGHTPRPADGNQMHPECELVAVIGKPARRVRESEALGFVGAYTVANDYAIREYLENYYRPNARVKNRDATTPIGPWLVDAADVADPQALALETRVNGVAVQHGSTADMILSVAGLIEYLSSFMTLLPGDMILTGTPHGVHFCQPGDVVETEIEGIGCLVSRLVGQ
ncbi:MAG TPA: fumarylacetoacetate hydrolase family protein [Sphingomonas sp.]|nr:fumarylacetoacetate hydrolase family protein [Sphingomonas sp.]